MKMFTIALPVFLIYVCLATASRAYGNDKENLDMASNASSHCIRYFSGGVYRVFKSSESSDYLFGFEETSRAYWVFASQDNFHELVHTAQTALEKNALVYAKINFCAGNVLSLSLTPEFGRDYISK